LRRGNHSAWWCGNNRGLVAAGKPTAVCPFFGDQPYWGRRVADLRVGPASLNRKALTAEALATAIVAMDDPIMCGRATALGAAIRSEDGVTAAVEFIKRRVVGKLPCQEVV
jgi:UDP:flavonoid glycosyltransferase YjiC (YdhE family)